MDESPFSRMSDDDIRDFTEATGLDPHDRGLWTPGDYDRAVAWIRREAKARQMEAIALAFEATAPTEPEQETPQ